MNWEATQKRWHFGGFGGMVLAMGLGMSGGCATAPADSAPAALAEGVGEAHGEDAWRAQRALSGDIHIAFDGRPPFEAKFIYEINGERARMELGDGTVLVFDGKEAWVSPASSPMEMARFHLVSWPYFIAAPFKLDDPGAHLTPMGEQMLAGRPYDAARLTFAPGTGDTPDDWYVVYTDPEAHRLEGMAYIVTYGRSLDEANREPHAITFYYDEKRINGVLLATEWKFWNWNSEVGLYGTPLGSGRLSNLRFVKPKANTFAKPADARVDELPKVAG